MPSLEGKRALITGASSGIGRAITGTLARRGVHVTVVGRSSQRLEAAATGIGEARCLVADLSDDASLDALLRELGPQDGPDLLVHSAGVYARETVEAATAEQLDLHHRVHVRGPFRLTRALLPALRERGGQVVFINSSVRGGAGLAAYATSKYAQRALAECLRAEENPNGLRVLTVYPGRTATPMQQQVCALEGREYHPEALVQPEDIADAVVAALELPESAELTDLWIRPSRKPSRGDPPHS